MQKFVGVCGVSGGDGGGGGGGTFVDYWVAGFLFFHEYNISGHEYSWKSWRNVEAVTLPISVARFSHWKVRFMFLFDI